MKGVLSDRALGEFGENGFVRTGLRLPGHLLSSIREVYERKPVSDSNWSFFELNAFVNYGWQGWKGLPRRLARRVAPWMVHLHVRRMIYNKSIFGSSEVLPQVLQWGLSHGLADKFGDISLLVGHDIYLEHGRGHKTFGFHHDRFGWDIFFQTDDDLSLYITLQDLTSSTGGRLLVEKHPNNSVLHKGRNEYIRNFAAFCRKNNAVDYRGLVTRRAVENSPNRRVIAREYRRFMHQRAALPTPNASDMNPIDAEQGEIVLFNNKRFHDVEPWNHDRHRAIYIVRFFPLYDMGLAPPATFLNNAPCNRFVIDGCRGTLNPIDVENELPSFFPIPV